MIWLFTFQESFYKSMEKSLYNLGIKKIEYYLKRYNLLDYKISKLSECIDEYDYKQTYSKWIKNKSSSLEDDAIRNIELEQKIYKIKKWQDLIIAILEHYKSKDKIKYKYICLKYFKHLTPLKIQERTGLTENGQEKIKLEVLNYILAVAIKKDMLKEVQI